MRSTPLLILCVQKLSSFSATIIPRHPSLSYFNRIKNTEIDLELETHSELTVFLPVDPAWESLHPIERLYLESEFATDDLLRILNWHAVGQGNVVWSESFDPGVNRRFSTTHSPNPILTAHIVTTMKGNHLEIVTAPEKVIVNDAELMQPDIYASNGVLHTVSSLLIPERSLKLTPEKFLLALNCTNFVSLLHSVNLTSLINDPSAHFTVLAIGDDVMSLSGNSDLPERGSDELKRALQYHFIPGRWTPKKMKHGLLLETELMEPGLDSGRQVIDIEVTHDHDLTRDAKVRFGGVGTVQDHG